jgi:hypothetical protein
MEVAEHGLIRWPSTVLKEEGTIMRNLESRSEGQKSAALNGGNGFSGDIDEQGI